MFSKLAIKDCVRITAWFVLILLAVHILASYVQSQYGNLYIKKKAPRLNTESHPVLDTTNFWPSLDRRGDELRTEKLNPTTVEMASMDVDKTVTMSPIGLNNTFGLSSGQYSVFFKQLQEVIFKKINEINKKLHENNSDTVRNFTSTASPKYEPSQEKRERMTTENMNDTNSKLNLSTAGPKYVTSQTLRSTVTTNKEKNLKRYTTVRPDDCDKCFKRPYEFLINSSNICSGLPDNTDQNSQLLLVMITTIHSHRDRRDAIRDSWVKPAKQNTHPNVRYAFLMGYTTDEDFEDVVEENKKHGDIIVQDFKEAYRNLTLKTLMALEWGKEFCPGFSFLMKTDDDVYVNIKNIYRLAFVDKHLKDGINGYCLNSARPIRNKKSKWYASVLEYPHASYQGFCSGTGYVLPRHVALDILQISVNIPFFYLEDVYLALCAKRLGYTLTFIGGFSPGKVPVNYAKCSSYGSEHMYTSHYMKPEEFLSIWKRCGKYVD